MVIKPSDKGGNNVLMSHLQYQHMCYDILNNREWYHPIDLQMVSSFENEFRGLCAQAHLKGLVDKDTMEYLVNPFPRTPTFYALPKVHKNLKCPPGRPIVSGIGSLSECASRYVDSFLLPHVTSLPSFIKDTPDLLRHVEGTHVPPGALLVVIDIKSLFIRVSRTSRASEWLSPSSWKKIDILGH